MKNKQFIYGLIATFILVLIAAQISIEHVFSLNGDTGIYPNQSVPTRTPTSAPQTPINTPVPKPTKSDGGGDDPATAVPTSTTQPLPTNTATPIVTIAYTPVNGFVPTAEPCSTQPTIQVQNPTNVRQGPGTDYPVVAQLVYWEVRFITGRAADAHWWLILLADGTNGWVADDVVTVQGYIGNVPIVSVPDEGQVPTSGTPWNPTPQPGCTAVPLTATFTPIPTVVDTAVPPTSSPPTDDTAVTTETETTTTNTETAAAPETTAAESTTANPSPESAAASPSAAAPEAQPTQTAVAPPTLMPVTNNSQSGPVAAAPPDSIAAQPDANPTQATATRSSTDWLLPIAGLLLVAGGATSFVTRRKK